MATTVDRTPAPAGPDFLSLFEWESSERYEFLGVLEGLWDRWDANDDRWEAVQRFIWTIETDRPAPLHGPVAPLRFDTRLGEAMLATVDAAEELHHRESLELTRPMIDAIRTSAAKWLEIADDAETVYDTLFGSEEGE